MFIATMFSYGRDSDGVGVDGIVSCMGIFVADKTQKELYAIHSPDSLAPVKDDGRIAFTDYILHQLPGISDANAHLYCVVNADNRQSADAEAAAYSRDLGAHQLHADSGPQAPPATAWVRRGSGGHHLRVRAGRHGVPAAVSAGDGREVEDDRGHPTDRALSQQLVRKRLLDVGSARAGMAAG